MQHTCVDGWMDTTYVESMCQIGSTQHLHRPIKGETERENKIICAHCNRHINLYEHRTPTHVRRHFAQTHTNTRTLRLSVCARKEHWTNINQSCHSAKNIVRRNIPVAFEVCVNRYIALALSLSILYSLYLSLSFVHRRWSCLVWICCCWCCVAFPLPRHTRPNNFR